MKKFLTQQINFAYAVITMLVLVVGIGSVHAVAPGGNVTPIIHPAAGQQAIFGGLQLGNCTNALCGLGPIGTFDARGGTNSVAYFPESNTTTNNPVFLATNLSAIAGNLFVGSGAISPTQNIWLNTYSLTEGTLAPVLQKVNVRGKARATNLTNTTGTELVCVDQVGGLQLCPTATPVNGACGSADGTTVSSAPTSNLCSSGNASSVSFAAGTYTWSCFGTGGGSTASCSASQTMTYAWDIGDWGACFSAGGGCSGTPSAPTGSVKIDWNGNPFNWTDGYVYNTQTINDYCPHLIGEDMANGATNANPLASDGSGDGNTGTASACIAAQGDEFPTPYVYEISADGVRWNRHHVSDGTSLLNGYLGFTTYPEGSVYRTDYNYTNAFGPDSGTIYRKRCDMNNNGDWSDDNFNGYCNTSAGGDQGEWENTGNTCSPVTDNGFLPIPNGVNSPNGSVDGVNVICYAAPSGGAGTCDGSTFASCTSVSGCSWTPPSPGTQGRTVVCRDSGGTVVDDSLCPQPKPDTTQSCNSGSTSLNLVEGCYPIEYDELFGSYGFAETFCSGRSTKTQCMYSNSYWWTSGNSGQSYPVASAPPADDYMTFAAHSYADTSATLVQMSDIDMTGQSLPVISTMGADLFGAAAMSSASCYSNPGNCMEILGPMCIWGEQPA